MYKCIQLISIIFLLGYNALGQSNTLKAIISSDDGLPKSFVAVEVYDSTFELISYTTLEEKSHFEIQIDTIYSTVNLVVSSLGCDTYFKRINFEDQKIIFTMISLTNCTQNLEEVVVTENRSFIEEDGNELTFDVDGFKKNTDITLGDILSRLPGIEISSSNQVLYQGKRIQKILIEGRDILNNQHSLALEGLKANDISEIKIIHDYKPFHKRFSEEYSSEVAMDIGLNEAAKGKTNGDAEILFGLNNKFEADLEAITVKSQNGNTLFLRSNNIGLPVIQPMEYLGLVTDFSRLEQKHSGELAVIPEAILPQLNASNEVQNMFSTNSDFDINEKTRGKITLLGIYKDIKTESDIYTDFFDTNTIFKGKEEGGISFPMLSANFNIKQEKSKNFLWTFDVPFEYHQQSINNSRTGNYGENSFESLFSKKENFIHFSPQLALSIHHKSGWASEHVFHFDLSNSSFDVSSFHQDFQQPQYYQELIDRKKLFSLVSAFENKYKVFLLKVRNRIDIGNYEVDLSSENLPVFVNKPSYSYQWFNWRPMVQVGIKNEKWMSHIQLETVQDYLNVNGQAFSQTWLNPMFRAKFNWSLSKFIGLTMQQKKSFLDPQKALGQSLLEGNQQLHHYFLASAGENTRIRLFDFYFFNLNKKNSTSLNFTVQYQDERRLISFFNRFDEGFIISEIFLAPKSETASMFLSLSRPFFNKKYRLKINFKTSYSEIDRDPYRCINDMKWSFSASISTKWDGKWNGNIIGSYQKNQQSQDIIETNWQIWAGGIGLRYGDEKWAARSDYSYKVNIVENSFYMINQLDFSLDYKILSSPFALTLSARDIFNLKPSQFFQLKSTPIYLEQVVYTRLQGSILIGAKYSFGRN